jgi:hypothetical protein
VSVALLNSLDVLTLTLTRERWGRAMLECTLADPLEDTLLKNDSTAVLDLAGVAQVFTGNVWRIGRVGGTTQVWALEAKALDKMLPAKSYANVQAGLVAVDILQACGLGGEVQFGGQLERYTRSLNSAMQCLNALCTVTNATWRTRPDGYVLIRGDELGLPKFDTALEWGDSLLEYDPVREKYTALLQPNLQAGMRLEVQPYGETREIVIERVQHEICHGKMRTHIWGRT